MNENIIDRIEDIEISSKMKEAFIDYSMSVIVSRALPDVRDGLKPVHRRIIYAMDELGARPNTPYKKSARVTGDTMGKYHPHGDLAIYDAMVRMAQDFSMRYQLVDGHGNFGSIDGDGAAAQRYTEARLSRLSMELLRDIEKETVDFTPNYDGEFQEPSVLPARFPNVLVNGSTGIAVGMATNIPPHNLFDCITAVIKRIKDMQEGIETPINTLIDIIKAPDFPTGGVILGTQTIKEAYETGRGNVVIRSRAEIIPLSSEREQIIVTEIPYQVNKANLVKQMADLVKDKKIDGITDIRDESNRNGIRIVIELRRDANSQVVLNQLYKLSSLQKSYGITLLCLVNKEPRILNILEIIDYYIAHQQEIITRRTQFDLRRAQKRAHILEGLLKALDIIEEIIKLIRKSKDATEARGELAQLFSFTDIQAQAIIDMRLRVLTGLEKERLQKEYDELQGLINELQRILSDNHYLLSVLEQEITEIVSRFKDPRRTGIEHDIGDISMEDLIDDEENVITLSYLNYIKRLPLDTYRSQNRGGKGVMGMKTRDEDQVSDMYVANTHDYILFFTNHGRAYRLRVFEIPEASRTARGMACVNLLGLNNGEKIVAMIPLSKDVLHEAKEQFLILVTRKGTIKRTILSNFANINKNGLAAINILEDDALVSVMRSDGKKEVFMVSANGKGIRFKETDIRPSGRASIGIRGMRLKEGDIVVGATLAEGQVLLVSENGMGKCTLVENCRGQIRGGQGIIVYKPTEKSGSVLDIMGVGENDELMIITTEGTVIRINISDISTKGRYSTGVKLINMDDGVKIASIARVNPL